MDNSSPVSITAVLRMEMILSGILISCMREISCPAQIPQVPYAGMGYDHLYRNTEPKQRAHFSLLAAGLASELTIDAIPYGRRFPVACSGKLQYYLYIESIRSLKASFTLFLFTFMVGVTSPSSS